MVDPVPALRRNGKLPSCEPCRKSKYSCDHGRPVCDRCERRGVRESCIYHPAPMTGASAKRRRISPHQSSPTSSLDSQWKNPDGRYNHDSASLAKVEGPPGFLGSTSYSAVFTEGQHQIEVESDQIANHDDETSRFTLSSSPGYAEKFERAVSVLMQLRSMPGLEAVLSSRFPDDCTMMVMGPSMPACLRSIKVDLIDRGIFQSDEAMKEAIEMLFRNTAKPMRINKNCKFNDFPQYFTGKNLRWEAVGHFFSLCGLCCGDLFFDDPLLDFVGHKPQERRALLHRLLFASNTCVDFCEDAGQLSDVAVWLIDNNCVFMSQVIGDAHYLVWRRAGDLSTAVFAQGLHEPQKIADAPFWLTEMRIRALASAYSVDKIFCTFLGRPPRISQRYCTIEVPLDLEYSEFSLDQAELEEILSRRDSNGWNTDGKMKKSAWKRCCVQICLIREEVLELSLGPPQENMLEKAMDVIHRNDDLYKSFPEWAHYAPNMWDKRDVSECFFAGQQYLDVLYNEFILRRMLVRRLKVENTELLQITQQIMAIVLESVVVRTHRISWGSIPWMVVLYGLPAAGVLALELLQQRQARSITTNGFSKSKVIQQLSIFISCLEWVHSPGDGNYQLVQQARKMLQQMLDNVLSPELLQPPEQPAIATPATSSQDFDDSVYDLSWLDNADFDGDFWMNLPDQPVASIGFA